MKKLWIDLETTGLHPVKHGIIQIAGIIELDGEEVEEFSFNVKPFEGDAVSPDSIKAHGISIEKMKAFDSPRETYIALVKLLGKYVDVYNKSDKFFMVGYNSKFDYDFLRKWFEKNQNSYLGSYIWFPPIDVMQLAAFHLMDRRSKIKNFKLMTVAEAVGLKPIDGKLHDARYDIRLTKELYNGLRSLDANTKDGSKYFQD